MLDERTRGDEIFETAFIVAFVLLFATGFVFMMIKAVLENAIAVLVVTATVAVFAIIVAGITWVLVRKDPI